MIFRTKFLFPALVCLMLTASPAATPQEARVNQKKIDREREKKDKKAVKEYNQAVRRHHAKQSKTTKKSMKRTKRESRNATPVNR